jgi:LemA protein
MSWIVWAVIAAVVLYVAYLFNSLIRLRQLVNEAWSGIDVQLKRRADLIPNLVSAVKGYASHERELLQRVTELRGTAMSLSSGDVAGRAQAENALGMALGKLVAIAEAYPDLKASGNFLELMRDLKVVEDELQLSRRYYNGAVRNLNTSIEQVPSNIVASIFRFTPREYFQLADAREGAVPQVNL